MLSPASRHAFSIFLVVALALTAVFAQSKPSAKNRSSSRNLKRLHRTSLKTSRPSRPIPISSPFR